MATITAVRDALADTLNIAGLTVYAFTPDNLAVPAAVILPDEAAPSANARGVDTIRYRIKVLVNRNEGRAAALLLDAYLASSGTKSLRALLHATPGLGLAGTHARYTGWENYGEQIWNDLSYLAADLLVTVETGGTA